MVKDTTLNSHGTPRKRALTAMISRVERLILDGADLENGKAGGARMHYFTCLHPQLRTA